MADRVYDALLRFTVSGKSLDELRGQLLKLNAAQREVTGTANKLARAALELQRNLAMSQKAGASAESILNLKLTLASLDQVLNATGRTLNDIATEQKTVKTAIDETIKSVHNLTRQYEASQSTLGAAAAAMQRDSSALVKSAQSLVGIDTGAKNLNELANASGAVGDAISKLDRKAREASKELNRVSEEALRYTQAVKGQKALFSQSIVESYARSISRLRQTYDSLTEAAKKLRAEQAAVRLEVDKRKQAGAGAPIAPPIAPPIEPIRIKFEVDRSTYAVVLDQIEDVKQLAFDAAKALAALETQRTPEHLAAVQKGDPMAAQLESEYQALLRLKAATQELAFTFQEMVSSGAMAYQEGQKRVVLEINKLTDETRARYEAIAAESKNVGREMNNLRVGSEQYADALARVATIWGQLQTTMTPGGPEFDWEAEFRRRRAEAYEYGRIGMSVRAIGRGASRVMGVQAIEPLFAVGDLVRGVRGFKLLSAELPHLRMELQKAATENAAYTASLAATTASTTRASKAWNIFMVKLAAFDATIVGLITKVGLAAAAIALLYVGFQALSRASKEAGRMVKAYMDTSKDYADAVASQTSAEIRDQQRQSTARLRAAEIERSSLKSLIDAVEDLDQAPAFSWEKVVGNIYNFSKLVGWNFANMEDAKKRYEELNDEIEATNNLNSLLRDSLDELLVRGNDLLALIEQYPDALAQAGQSQMDALVDAWEAGIGVMSTGELEDLIAQQEAYVAVLRAQKTAAEEALETGTETQQDSAKKLLPQLKNELTNALIDLGKFQLAYARGLGEPVDALIELQARLDFDESSAQRALEWATGVSELNAEINKMVASPGSPEDVAQMLADLNEDLKAQERQLAEINALHEAGELTGEAFLNASYDAQSGLQLLRMQIELIRLRVYPAAVALEDYNKGLARQEEAHKRALAWIDQENELRMEATGRAFTEEDPQAVIDDIQSLQLQLLGWHEHLRELSRQLKIGVLAQDEHREKVAAANAEIQRLTTQMGLLETKVLPAARATEKFLDGVDRMIAEMELKAEQARVDADRRLAALREQEDFERSRARALAEHYAGLAELDANYAERIADELEKSREAVADDRKKEIDEEIDFNKEMQRMAEDHRRKLLEIARDLAKGLGEAVEERSVTAAIEAIRRSKEEIEDEEYKYNTEKRRRWEDFQDRMRELAAERAARQQDYEDRLAELREQHAKERAARIAEFNARLAEEDEERRIEAERQREDWAREDKERRDHYLKVEEDIRQSYINQRRAAQVGMAGVETEVAAAWTRLTNYVRDSQQQLAAEMNAARAQQQAAMQQALLQQQQLQAQIIRDQQEARRQLQIAAAAPLGQQGTTATGRFRPVARFARGGVPRPGDWVLVGEPGPEMARFNRDGSWEVLNPQQTKRELQRGSGVSLSLTMPVAIYDASNPREIETIFEDRIMPKIVRQFQRVAATPRGRYF